MTAIETKYVGPTDIRGARISVRALATRHRALISYPVELSEVAAHAYAVQQLCRRLGWPTLTEPIMCSNKYWEAGDTLTGYVWVLVNPASPDPHDWQEQPGEPPRDVCSRCGAVRH